MVGADGVPEMGADGVPVVPVAPGPSGEDVQVVGVFAPVEEEQPAIIPAPTKRRVNAARDLEQFMVRPRYQHRFQLERAVRLAEGLAGPPRKSHGGTLPS